jgi:putative copper export protein
MIERYFGNSGALAALVLITGLLSASLHLTNFDDIGGTEYGRLLAGKVGIVLMLLVFNEHHRRHAERKARTAERAQLARSLRFEAGLIGLILALTAILLDASPPGSNEVRTEVFRVMPAGSHRNNDIGLEP